MSLDSLCWVKFVFIDGDLEQGFEIGYFIHEQASPRMNKDEPSSITFRHILNDLGSLMTPPLTPDEVHPIGMFSLEVVGCSLPSLPSVSEQSNTTFLADWGDSRE